LFFYLFLIPVKQIVYISWQYPYIVYLSDLFL
jgi:hypothetical protein